MAFSQVTTKVLGQRMSQTRMSIVAVAATLIVSASLAFGQDLGDDSNLDDTLMIPQSGSLTIEPYTGPPIFLPDPPPTIAAKEIESRTLTEYFDPKEKTKPRIERGVVRYSDESIKNHGPYREYYSSGQLFVEGRYDQGEPMGDWKYFHENGTESKTVYYEKGRLHGKIECHHADGTLQSSREFAKGLRHGDWEIYDVTGKTLLREEHYKNGKPSGLWKYWHPNGTQLRQTPFVKGKIDGTVVEWDDKGVKRGEAKFSKGQRNGTSHVWMLTGQHIEQEYEKGKLLSSKTAAE